MINSGINTPALSALSSGGSSDPVYVLRSLIRRVELYDPVHSRDVQTSGGDVRTEQHSGVLTKNSDGVLLPRSACVCIIFILLLYCIFSTSVQSGSWVS